MSANVDENEENKNKFYIKDTFLLTFYVLSTLINGVFTRHFRSDLRKFEFLYAWCYRKRLEHIKRIFQIIVCYSIILRIVFLTSQTHLSIFQLAYHYCYLILELTIKLTNHKFWSYQLIKDLKWKFISSFSYRNYKKKKSGHTEIAAQACCFSGSSFRNNFIYVKYLNACFFHHIIFQKKDKVINVCFLIEATFFAKMITWSFTLSP